MQKTISALCASLGLSAMPVKFKHASAGVIDKRKGYDLVNSKGYIIVTIEPHNDTTGNRWLVSVSKCEVLMPAEHGNNWVTVTKGELIYLKNLRRVKVELAHFEGMPVDAYYTRSSRGDHQYQIEQLKKGNIIK